MTSDERCGKKPAYGITGEKIFAPLPDPRSRWWTDKAARHTCAITKMSCKHAFRCRYSVAEAYARPGRAGQSGNVFRQEACAWAIDRGLGASTGVLCQKCIKRKKGECPKNWSCWFFRHFEATPPPPLSL